MVERLIAQLAHAEVTTPKPEQSAAFFKNVLGLEESGRAGQSVYFRGWGEFFHHSLQLTEGPVPSVAHTGWRTEGPEELQTCVKRLEAAGFLRREIDAADLRRHRLVVTPTGRKAMSRGLALLSDGFGVRLERLSTAERAALQRLLEKLA